MNNNERHSTLEWSERILKRYQVFEPKYNENLLEIAKLLGNDMHSHMAQGFALFHMTALVNSFKFALRFDSNGVIPLNVIITMLAESGSGKTSSELIIRKAFEHGYNEMDAKIEASVDLIARDNDIDKKLFKKLPYFNGIGTGAGFVKRINQFATARVGVPSLIIDEIVSNLKTEPETLVMIKMVSELFDSGEKTDKPLKDRANQDDEIHGMGVNTLIMGTDAGMFDGSQSMEMFLEEFASKLSRRCIFIYPPKVKKNELVTEDEHNRKVNTDRPENAKTKGNIYHMILRIIEFRKKLLKDELNLEFEGVQSNVMEELSRLELSLEGDARIIYDNYREYCKRSSDKLPHGYILSSAESNAILEHENRHWKMLKIAGVFAVFRGSLKVNKNDLREAITLVEEMSVYLKHFIEQTSVTVHEKVYRYIQDTGHLPTSHEMKKFKWITDNKEIGSIMASVQDMVTDGTIEHDGAKSIYTYKANDKVADNGKVQYSFLDRTENQSTSDMVKKRVQHLGHIAKGEHIEQFIEHYGLDEDVLIEDIVNLVENDAKVSIDKIKISRSSIPKDTEFKYDEFNFKDLVDVFNSEKVIVPFKYENNLRNKNLLLGKTKLLIIDVDESTLDIEEVHEHLKREKLNHIVTTTSDYTKLFKFRIAIELDHEINVSEEQFNIIQKAVGDKYSINVDELPRTQLMLCYKDSLVLSYFDGKKLNIDDLNSGYEKHIEQVKVFRRRRKIEGIRNLHDTYKHWFSGKRDDTVQHRIKLGGLVMFATEVGEDLETIEILAYDYFDKFKTDKSHFDSTIRTLRRNAKFNNKGK